jgi:hypothetical protein
VPVSYTIDKEAGLIRTRCEGNVTLAEVLNHFQVLKDDPERPNHLDVFLDLREMTSSPTADQIREASRGPRFLGGLVKFGFCAIVVDRDVIYGMSRMWAVFVEQMFTEVVVFRSVAEAEIWLKQCRTYVMSLSSWNREVCFGAR